MWERRPKMLNLSPVKPPRETKTTNKCVPKAKNVKKPEPVEVPCSSSSVPRTGPVEVPQPSTSTRFPHHIRKSLILFQWLGRWPQLLSKWPPYNGFNSLFITCISSFSISFFNTIKHPYGEEAHLQKKKGKKRGKWSNRESKAVWEPNTGPEVLSANPNIW